MSEITLRVGGRPYTVSCTPGEEDHVRHLGAIVDGKLSALGPNRAPGDARNLLIAALLLANELEEAQRGQEATLSADVPSQELAASQEIVIRGLETLADRLEAAAQVLENGVPSA